MNNQDIKKILITELDLKQTYVTGDNNHIKIIAVGDVFRGVSKVKRQQIVYTPLINMITEKHVHAISIISYTPEEWEKNKKNNNHSDDL
ncbi:BolA family transcriptional regulator [Buchnera aphidicola (Hyperomyzus lactucae)]|uniref:BolA family transcriptional regulator n=1 Tax=Buchnera aphidicola (Hyperomyzus lactucae) TaxID=1241860 RepID=A0A4D6XWW0_9GAMM|nr:BolA family protein [Buchnera aphidicola]QCI21103.1 BolA family transcriptional regulator [Buchnera aphidicola (Hyperomyzus lactucae)]